MPRPRQDDATPGKRGPRTPAGRAAVRNNALKDGFYALDPVIESIESREEWFEFERRIIDSYGPVDDYQRCIVSQIAATLWRWRRIPRAEADAIERSMHHVEFTHEALAGYRSFSLSVEEARTLAPRFKQALHLVCEVDALDGEAPVALPVASSALAAMIDPDEHGLLDELPDPPLDADGHPRCTVASVREAIALLAERTQAAPEALRERAVEVLNKLVAGAESRVAGALPAMRHRYVPDEPQLSNLIRADAHLRRQLTRLESLFDAHAARLSGRPLPLVRVQHLGYR